MRRNTKTLFVVLTAALLFAASPSLAALTVAPLSEGDDLLSKFSSYLAPDIPAMDEYAQKLVFSTDTVLLKFKFFDVGWKEVGDNIVFFENGVLYATNELTPQIPLVVNVSFPGTFPTRGVSFTDKAGATRQFYFVMSGEDGSISLKEF